ncbi:hypothetical protein P0082_06595 [Candidatus Haliotispira prima]|uniref:LysM domain-containing protein n=1 Tax=Candidatus Haliotispira prima TaxID=3034016 RepID=A0ABY8MDU1_9SPIO|nr:hypothetical protein P0082_06595 [Candidatus Haliotispira prima]
MNNTGAREGSVNIQLQRMMVVLFLVLTIIAVTVLFWLPENNDSGRILVAKESASDGLLDLESENKAEDRISGLDSEGAESEPVPAELELVRTDDAFDGSGQAELELLADERELRRERDPADYLVAGAVRSEEPKSSDDTAKNHEPAPDSAPMAVGAAKRKAPAGDGGYTYDVMGNKRAHVSDHTVRKNDWFSTITGRYWDDLFMWPDLYTMNSGNLSSANPDLIFPGEKVSIYESLTADGNFSEEDRSTLLSAYLKVYKIYKQVGESKDLAAVRLLASAVRYDENFLENYSGVIAPKDKEMAHDLIREQKFLD